MSVTVGRIYLDANIFVHAFEVDDEIAPRLFELFAASERRPTPILVTSELSLAETLVVPLREHGEMQVAAYDRFLTTSGVIEVAPIDRETLHAAAVLRAAHRSLRLPDAIHLATALLLRCSHFLTSDKRLGGVQDVVLHRSGISGDPRSTAILRPEPRALEELIVAQTA